MKLEEAKRVLKESGYLAPLWHKEDILHQAKEDMIRLSEEKLEEVVELLENSHDATIGINWEVISTAIDTVMGGENGYEDVDFKDWTASELFEFLVGQYLISEDEVFEDWMNDRVGMIELVEDNFKS